MRASVRLGSVAGISVGIHYSWLLIATLITLSLAAHFQATQPTWSGVLIWTSAAATSVLFFATLVAHELSHALVARARGLPVRSITLFALGGIARIEKEPDSASTEFWMASVGPFTSLVIGAVCIVAARAGGWTPADGASGPVAAILGWLGSINVVLAVFNLVPGYPLDGGRILRSVLWGLSGSLERATRDAARTGQVIAALFIGLGLLRVMLGAGLGGLWLAMIGWFLLEAAGASYSDVIVKSSLQGIRTGEVMETDCATISQATSISACVERMLRSGRRCYIVTDDNGRVVGLVTPRDVRAVDRGRWSVVDVGSAMRRLEGLRTVDPATPVAEALSIMSGEGLHQLPVVDDGHLAGVLTEGGLLRLMQLHNELKTTDRTPAARQT